VLALSVVAALVLAGLAAFRTHQGEPIAQERRAAESEASEEPGPEEAREKAEELAEIRAETRARLRTQEIIEREGEAKLTPVTGGPAPGWLGEKPFGKGNDWEPAIAADPGAPYVYVVTTRFGRHVQACNNCPRPAIVMRVSDDNGMTWGPVEYVCKCPGENWQYDPQIEVADDGTVFATWLSSGWHTWVSYSDDHGATWSDPVDSKDGIGWSDHGFLTISPDGGDVYVAFNRSVSFVAASHDGGASFEPPVRTNPQGQNRYYYHYNGVVLPGGEVVIAATSLPYDPYARGIVRYLVLRSTDGGTTWDQIPIDYVQEQPDCYTQGCRHDHWAGLSSIGMDDDGDLVYAYSGTRRAHRGQLTFVSTSEDGGLTWSTPQALSPVRAHGRRVVAAFNAVVGTGDGDFRVWWMDDRNGRGCFNVWYSTSSDGGANWSDEVRISDANSGAGYKHPCGFDGDYGDYGEMDLTYDGKAVAAWGEAFGYYGPGGTWINREA